MNQFHFPMDSNWEELDIAEEVFPSGRRVVATVEEHRTFYTPDGYKVLRSIRKTRGDCGCWWPIMCFKECFLCLLLACHKHRCKVCEICLGGEPCFQHGRRIKFPDGTKKNGCKSCYDDLCMPIWVKGVKKTWEWLKGEKSK